ncbi:TetR/AcrR family transcriptional regulator [Peteryoungia ipomoeae]|uniref:TetR/AcrR family transcriptional regulator n=1 Tax=Peteryoungia ipomoeae TaxID=1210932 RepID=A0A4S8P6R6_9HYPH|nr:TetR/AcrR family transcriptional regulator [Peteryoungia ipomoeae]THV25121.1 TetR/AcrR family transcriptional regulator [Peteryoungia ipomoeae]
MKLSQERSRQTREQILDAARALFAQQGFEATSIEQVAGQAGVAKASIFAHFGDKTNLLAALGIERIETLLETSRAYATVPGLPVTADEIMAIFEPWLAYFGDDPDFARLYLSQSGLTGGAWTERFLAVCRDLESVVADFLSSGLPACSADRSLLLSRGLQALFHEVIVYRISGWTESHREAADMLKRFVVIWLAGARTAE